MKFKVVLILSSIFCLLFTSLGCEAFRKKFVRKPKKEKEVKIVVETYEYESQYSPQTSYKKYFSFWRGWQDELINSLDIQHVNRKKLTVASEKIVANLDQMHQLLLPEKQKELEGYIAEQKEIAMQLQQPSLSRTQILEIKSSLERNKKQIQKEFNYKKIQQYLVGR